MLMMPPEEVNNSLDAYMAQYGCKPRDEAGPTDKGVPVYLHYRAYDIPALIEPKTTFFKYLVMAFPLMLCAVLGLFFTGQYMACGLLGMVMVALGQYISAISNRRLKDYGLALDYFTARFIEGAFEHVYVLHNGIVEWPYYHSPFHRTFGTMPSCWKGRRDGVARCCMRWIVQTGSGAWYETSVVVEPGKVLVLVDNQPSPSDMAYAMTTFVSPSRPAHLAAAIGVV
ncbi:hypothetical protein HNP46_000409 [Pseudomonas nitritireducens]|uniref:Uncharacterized protein n=1 Tax=Pseudomonas nitroreducens TaxID=46680 RepID=A0A7W7KG06_PSENT|nr:hypothetical protein [Pseudomonas nitritireducens]MBB4861598.1 hypothetical protein [Pseudomonas nitritireducens]